MVLTSAMPASNRSISTLDDQLDHLQSLLRCQASALGPSADFPGPHQYMAPRLPTASALIVDSQPVAITMPQDLSWLLDSVQQTAGISMPSDSFAGLVPPVDDLIGSSTPLAASDWAFLQPRSFEIASTDSLYTAEAATLARSFSAQSGLQAFPPVFRHSSGAQRRADTPRTTLTAPNSLGEMLGAVGPEGSVLPQPTIEPPLESQSVQHSASYQKSKRSPNETVSCVALPQVFTDLIVVVDLADTVLYTSDAARLCASLLSNSTTDSGGDESAGWHARMTDDRRVKFSDLLADKHAVDCWQRACVSLQSPISALSSREQTPNRSEMILKRRTPDGTEALVEVVIVAPTQDCSSHRRELMILMRPVALPSVAAVLHNPFGDPTTRASSLPDELSKPEYNQQAVSHLLVSRSGLILRTSHSPSSLGPTPYEHDAAIFGDPECCPIFGQSLVDVPRLAPLLPVVTQVAVVGLAQSVELNAAAGRVTAIVRPVLRRTIAVHRLPAAKVWITLSMPRIVKHRPTEAWRKSDLVSHSQASPLREVSKGHRHGSPPKLPAATSACRMEQTAPLQDSLSPLIARLREENRLLRQQVEARLRKRGALDLKQHISSA